MPRLMEVLEFLDDSGKTMVKRVPDDGPCEVKWGAQLTVRESQSAVFFRDGRALEVFGPGRHVLRTPNLPVVTKWVTSFGYGPDSPFRAEVYFLNRKLFPNLKWGTPSAVVFRDSELKMVRLRSHGIYSIQIADPLLFLNKVVGTEGLYYDDTIANYLRNIIVARLTDILGKELKTVFDLPADFNRLALVARSRLTDDFTALGLELHDFYINAISLPDDVQNIIDMRSAIAALGNLDEFMKFKAAMALESAADNPGGAAGAGVGVGAGMGLGFMLPQYLQQAMQTGIAPIRETQETVMDRIRKLKDLLDQGAITAEEFTSLKKKLIDEI
ncbi:SPFH domain-containing protein [bacterium]|nr:SPFH domain-containing protein [bacterium]MBU1983810.1 SPFH domain-containing protein [bacterium]